MSWRRRLVRYRTWTPLDSRRSLALWLAAWGLVIVGAPVLNYFAKSPFWTPVLLYPVIATTTVPAWLNSRRLNRVFARRGFPQMPKIGWAIAMLAGTWLLLLILAVTGLPA